MRHPEKAARPDSPSPRKPPWIRVKAPGSPEYHATRRLMRELQLNTVCEEAACPNIGECWKEKHATVMILVWNLGTAVFIVALGSWLGCRLVAAGR